MCQSLGVLRLIKYHGSHIFFLLIHYKDMRDILVPSIEINMIGRPRFSLAYQMVKLHVLIQLKSACGAL